MTFQIDMKNAVLKIDAGVSNESIPNGGDARVLFCGVGSFEVFVHSGMERVDRGEDISGDNLIGRQAGISRCLFACKYDIDLDHKRCGSQ